MNRWSEQAVRSPTIEDIILCDFLDRQSGARNVSRRLQGEVMSVRFLQELRGIAADLGISFSFCFRLHTQHSLSLLGVATEEWINLLLLAHLLSSSYMKMSLHKRASFYWFFFSCHTLAVKVTGLSSHKQFSVEESSTEPVPNTSRNTNTSITYTNPKRRYIDSLACSGNVGVMYSITIIETNKLTFLG